MGPSSTRDHKVKIAALKTVSLANLLAKDPAEVSRLAKACKSEGFFYLDFGSPHHDILQQSEKTLAVIKTFYNQPLESKLPFWRGRNLTGYKPLGTDSGVLNSTKDGYESFRILKDEIKTRSEVLPLQVLDEGTLFESFIEGTHAIVVTILSALSDALGVPVERRFENFHRWNQRSRAAMEYLKYAKQRRDDPNVGHNMHTDLGTLSVLLCVEWGLQVRLSESSGWEYVQPKPGMGIVNVGDTLRFLSGGALRSVLHRVVPMEEHADRVRYTVGYFLRAEDETVFKDQNGNTTTAHKWHDKKVDVYTAAHSEQRKNDVLTGGLMSVAGAQA